MTKSDWIISPQDGPIERKKKLDKYFFVLIAFVVIIGFWPFAIILFFSKEKITKEIEKSFYKVNSQKQAGEKNIKKSPHNTQDTYKISQTQYKSDVGTDRLRSILTIIAFLILLTSIAFYYFLKYKGII